MSKEKKIAEIMEKLEVTREEALELMAFDDGETELAEVDEMTQKAKKVATPVKRGRKPKAESQKTGMAGVTQQTRAKKENPTKATIIAKLFQAIQELEGVQNAENPNKEKTIMFELEGNTYEIDLKQKRKPKQ